ncbi:MAG: hypothetical protein ACNA7E_00985 [Wenzhouxiangellaceae bacterium]
MLPALVLMLLLAGCQTTSTVPDEEEMRPPQPPGAQAEKGGGNQSAQATGQETGQESGHAQEALAQEASQETGETRETEQPQETDPASELAQGSGQTGAQAGAQGGAQAAEPEVGRSQPALQVAGRENQAVPADAADEPAAQGVPRDSDERFREAMDRFDRRLDREEFDSTRPTAGGGAEAGGAGAGQQGSAGAEGDREEALAGGGTPFDVPEEDESGMDQRDPRAAGGLGRRSAEYPVPPDIPDRADDDIVARQLRAAAENEPDPELRARLWDEYRAYKDNQ